MREFASIRKILATLLTICLIVTLGFSSLDVIQAETQNESKEVEKILLQSDTNWSIFKYIDETGEPHFDVEFRGQTVDKLEEFGYLVLANIFIKDIDSEPYKLIVSQQFNSQHISEEILESYNKDDIIVSFSVIDSNDIKIGNSDYFSYYKENLHMFYWDLGGFEYSINRPHNGDSQVNVTIYFSEPLEGDISANASSDNHEVNNFLKKNPIEDIDYYNDDYEVVYGDIQYRVDYSIVTFSVKIIDQVHGQEDGKSSVKYIINFNNVLSSAGGKVKPLVFNVDTPMLYDPDYKEPTTEEPTDEPTTVEPTTKEPIKVETTTTYIEPTTKYVEPATQKVTQKYVKKVKIKGKKTLKVGKKLKLKVTLTPKKAKYKKIKWSVSKKKYAKITQKGVLTAKKAGKGKTVTVKVKITNITRKGAKKYFIAKYKIKIK